ncbi:MAG: ComF family protein [Hyphomicrobiales bacterium]
MGALQTVADAARQVATSIADIVLPPRCLVCATPAMAPGGLCGACWSALSFLSRNACPPVEGLESLSAPVVFDAASRPVVHALKYRDRHEAVPVMARQMTLALRPVLAEVDLVVPVPLHPVRLWQRRFNQAALLSHAVARLASKPCVPEALLRTRATPPQVGLSAAERLDNVRRAFAVNPRVLALLPAKSVLLVDDVFTTGATMAACAAVLKRAGAAAVHGAVYALAPPPGRSHI